MSLVVHLELFLHRWVHEGAGRPSQLRHQLVVDGLEALTQGVHEVAVEEALVTVGAPLLTVVLDVDVWQSCGGVRGGGAWARTQY